MVKTFALAALMVASVAAAEETASSEYTNIALVRAGLSNLAAGGGLGFEHQFSQKVSGIIGVGFSYNSNGTGTVFGTAAGITTGASPGVRFYLGDRALMGVFLGVELPIQFQWTSAGSSAAGAVGFGIVPQVGISMRFDRLVIQLDFGIGAVGRISLSSGSPGLGTLYPGGFSVALSSGVSLGYIF